MSQPPSYERYQRQADYQASHPLPGPALDGSGLDAEFDRIKTTLDAALSNLRRVQRDDGAISNASVGLDQLKSEVAMLLKGVNPRGDWSSDTGYAANDIVRRPDGTYMAKDAHVSSGDFAADLSAGHWMLLSLLSNAGAVSFSSSGGVTATNVQDAITELDGKKQSTTPTLAALAAVALAANVLIYGSGPGAAATTPFTAFARDLLSSTAAADALSKLGGLAKSGDTMDGPLILSVAPENGADAANKAYVDATVAGQIPPGTPMFYSGLKLPEGGWVWGDGAEHDRSELPDLYAATNAVNTVTMTVGTPCTVTWAAHGLKNGYPVKFKTTGALPVGITIGVNYFIVNATTDTFQFAATQDGAAINTSGTQSGVHTAICSPHGDGNGSTTFRVIDMRGRMPLGLDAMPGGSAAGRLTGGNFKQPGAASGSQTHAHNTTASGSGGGNTHVDITSQISNSGGQGAPNGTGNQQTQNHAHRVVGDVWTPVTVNTAGSTDTRDHLPPYVACPWIVKT